METIGAQEEDGQGEASGDLVTVGEERERRTAW